MSHELPSLGDVIAGRYKLIEPLGEGGMGAVYKAEQIGLGREVAVKVILPERASNERAKKRFLREAKVTASVKHPGVVQIYDYGEVEGVIYIAMEVLSGPTLRHLVDYDMPPLPQDRAIEIALPVAETLEATAKIPLVHRDLKPENVLFDKDLSGNIRVVLVDFGLAFETEGDDTTGRLTREGVLSGTPDYMSPEQCRADRVTPASDVYALGCMMYEMLTSEPPFKGEPAVQLSRHLFVPPKRIRHAFPDIKVHGSLDDLVMDMLQKDPASRPSASDVAERLRRMNTAQPERMNANAHDEDRLGRAARMISAASIVPPPMKQQAESGVLWWRDASASVSTLDALAVGGVVVIDTLTQPPRFDVIFAPGATPEEVTELSKEAPVIGMASSKNMDELTALLRAGAKEALMPNYEPSDLVRRVQRVLRKLKRER